MTLLQGLLLIGSIHLLAAASPGPDFVLVSQQTLSKGRRAGLLCSLGIALGLSVHILYSALGLAVVIANSVSLLWAIKLLGAGYLIYLGINGVLSKQASEQEVQEPVVTTYSPIKMVGVGFLCNVLNPKAPIYFVAVFTLVLSPEMPLYHIAIYGLWMMLLQLAWFSFVASLLSHPSVNARFRKMGYLIDRVLGGLMVVLGLKLLFSRAG